MHLCLGGLFASPGPVCLGWRVFPVEGGHWDLLTASRRSSRPLTRSPWPLGAPPGSVDRSKGMGRGGGSEQGADM